MLKVVTIVGTRPEIIRLSRIIPKLDRHTDHVLVHTGQNFDYELNEIFFDDLEIRKPDFFLDAAGKNPSQTIGNVISKVDDLFETEQPDAILILGDTNSSLCAIPAKRRKIPIFHMEAGNRCFDLRVPEEINRKIVDHISDINLTYSQIAREYLIMENFPPDQIINTGSPMKEVLTYYEKKIQKSQILKELNINSDDYFLFSFHREENVDSKENLTKIIEIMSAVVKQFSKKIIVSTHPRTKDRIENLNISHSEEIIFLKPFCFTDYINLQLNSRCVISDSGTITEESSILGFRALNLREVNERPEGFEEGAVIMTGLEKDIFMNSLDALLDGDNQNHLIDVVYDYDTTSVSEKILRIILSYTNYINKKVWKK